MRKWMLVAMAASVSGAAPAGAQNAAPGDTGFRMAVPATVSPQAAAELRAVYQLLASQPRAVQARPASVADWDRQYARTEAFMEPFIAQRVAALKATVTPDKIGGVPVLRIRPEKINANLGPLVYVHGGAYTWLSAKSTRATPALIATATGREVISIDYTVAPHARWEAITDQVLAVWKALLASGIPPASIGLLGDSAGGGLAAGATLKMRDRGLALPGALFLISPWLDVTSAGDTKTTLAAVDPIVDTNTLSWSADAYADPADQKNPYVSPVYGDYSKPFPPTIISGGTREALLSDFVREYQAIRSGGHEAVLDLYEGMPHVFQTLAFNSPETSTSANRAAAFFGRHLKPLTAKTR